MPDKQHKPGAPRGNSNALKSATPRNKFLSCRCTEDEHVGVLNAAEAQGVKPSEWLHALTVAALG